MTMKPVPKSYSDDDSVTELKKNSASIVKVISTKLDPLTSGLFQTDKAFNASKEELDYIDNNEEETKVKLELCAPDEPAKKENGYITVLK